MLRNILVPTDFSAPSDAALGYARTFVRTFGGELHLFHVVTDAGTPPHVSGNPRDREPAALRRIRERLTAEDRQHHVKVRVVEGSDPAHKIAQQARARQADLIVMGTHGRSGVAHLLIGSVAENVVRTAPCPVLTVRRAPQAPLAGFNRILVPTDFSGPSDTALDYARLIALRFGAAIHLLHVVDDRQAGGSLASEVFVSDTPAVRTALLSDARERLAHRVSAYDHEDKRVTTEVVFGAVARSIVDYADDNGFDLIVMGTHGRTGIEHLLTGSVAERVVRSATCPVITTHDVQVCADLVPAETAAAAVA